MQPVKIIRSVDELEELLHKINSTSQIAIQLPFLSNQENRYWTEKIDGYGDSCGCDAGGFGGMLGLICVLVYGAVNHVLVLGNPTYYGLRGLIFVVLCSFIAKIFSILVQRYLRFRDLRSIYQASLRNTLNRIG